MVIAKASVAQGLYHLSRKAYLPATESFLSIDPALEDNFRDVMTASEIAVCGALCALASPMNLTELQKQVLDQKSFRHYLELEPHIRRVMSLFCTCRFRQALDILEDHRRAYISMRYIQFDLPIIYELIQVKAIQLYISPFSRITFDALASIFDIPTPDTPQQQQQQNQQQESSLPEPPTTESSYDDTSTTLTPSTMPAETQATPSFCSRIVGLVEDGRLNAMIDLEHNWLIPRPPKSREDIYQKTLGNLQQYSSETHQQLVRVQMSWANVSVPQPNLKQTKENKVSSYPRER